MRDGDPTSSSNGEIRWELIFNHVDGKEYLRQLGVMKATLVFAEPPGLEDAQGLQRFDQCGGRNSLYNRSQLPPLYFIDDECGPLVLSAGTRPRLRPAKLHRLLPEGD